MGAPLPVGQAIFLDDSYTSQKLMLNGQKLTRRPCECVQLRRATCGVTKPDLTICGSDFIFEFRFHLKISRGTSIFIPSTPVSTQFLLGPLRVMFKEKNICYHHTTLTTERSLNTMTISPRELSSPTSPESIQSLERTHEQEKSPRSVITNVLSSLALSRQSAQMSHRFRLKPRELSSRHCLLQNSDFTIPSSVVSNQCIDQLPERILLPDLY
jgi:hypothetical protein